MLSKDGNFYVNHSQRCLCFPFRVGTSRNSDWIKLSDVVRRKQSSGGISLLLCFLCLIEMLCFLCFSKIKLKSRICCTQDEVARHADLLITRGIDTYLTLPVKVKALMKYAFLSPEGTNETLQQTPRCRLERLLGRALVG